MATWARSLWILLAFGALGCSERPRFDLGGQCDLSSQCAAPLVCRLDFCREECRDDRDCRAGLVCLRDEAGLGACALDRENTCTLTSECPSGLVCAMGRCANECEDDVDCPSGAMCLPRAPTTEPRGCVDMVGMECEHHSDCPVDQICTPARRCGEQCHGDRDCRDGTVCDEPRQTCVLPSEIPDGGPADAGDAGPPPDGGTDGGMITVPAPAPTLAGGYQHTCALRSGALLCWGSSFNGQIGDNMFVDRPTPVVVSALSSPTLVAAGANHTCALDASGVRCWGDNTLGQVGDGTMVLARASPVATGIASATWLATGRDHSCALDGTTLRCWGANANGQLGDGTMTGRRAPVAVLGLRATPVEVTARARHTCARLDDGTAQCWGENTYGQLGNGITSGSPTPMPVDVAGVDEIVEIVAGSTHVCARRRDGSVWCWGSNAFGQLGDGTTTDRPAPASVVGAPAMNELAAGLDHVCGRAFDGTVWCWGGNTYGQGGQDPLLGPDADTIVEPTQVPGVAGATELVAGDYHTCARIGADAVRCWGWNSRGQLGDGTMMDRHSGVMVSFP